MTDTKVILVNGAPGCGKTKSLLDAVEQHADSGNLGMFDFYLANFTNNGREATADDLIERGIFDLSQYEGVGEDDLRSRCRTLHSIAMGVCPEIDDPEHQIVSMDENPSFYSEFCTQNGLDFEPEETNPLELIKTGAEDKPKGNKLFSLDQWLHAKYHPSADRYTKIREAPVDIELSPRRVESLLDAWDTYKREESRSFEHHDYIDVCIENGYTPDVDFLGVDEFQDLSPVEYALFKQWRNSGDLTWVYICGDVNQSIYSFRCASPVYLSETDVDERRYLTKSYRCPAAVSSVSRSILEAEPTITRNVFRTASRGSYTPEGEAELRSLRDGEELGNAVLERVDDVLERRSNHDGAAVYLLTRTNWQLGRLAQQLQRQGIPFDALGDKMTPWADTVVDCLIALRAVAEDRPAPRDQVRTLIAAATNSERRKERFENADVEAEFRVDPDSAAVYFPDQIRAAFPGSTAMAIVDTLQLTDYQKDMLRGALDSNSNPNPELVQVGTIHEAKGLQAPSVFLFTGATSNIAERYREGEGRAEEHRIFYVGATRASESLTVVDGFFDGATHPIFEDGLPGGSADDAGDVAAEEVAD